MFRSTHIQTLPFFFSTTTIPVHHRVGWSTLETTPKDSIRLSSSSTWGRSGNGTCRSVKIACGIALGLSLIVNSSPRFPRPSRTSGNFLYTSMSSEVVSSHSSAVSILASKLSAVMAGRPKRLPVTTYTFAVHSGSCG